MMLASLSTNTYVNVMAQYRPCYKASEVEAMARGITTEEFKAAVQSALDAGLTRLDEYATVLREVLRPDHERVRAVVDQATLNRVINTLPSVNLPSWRLSQTSPMSAE